MYWRCTSGRKKFIIMFLIIITLHIEKTVWFFVVSTYKKKHYTGKSLIIVFTKRHTEQISTACFRDATRLLDRKFRNRDLCHLVFCDIL